MGNETVIIFYMLGNDHLANVRSLQNIYQQSYDNVVLIAINDCSDGFQSERFFYNLNDKEHKGVRQIIFEDSPFPRGEMYYKRKYLKQIAGEYMVTIHAGDRFVNQDSLGRATAQMNSDSAFSAIVTGMSQYINLASSNRHIDNCTVLYRISEWESYTDFDEHSRLISMHRAGKLLFSKEVMCEAAHLKCFKHPNFQAVDLSSALFCKTNVERMLEASEPQQENRELLLHKLTHRRMIALYGAIWMLFLAAFLLVPTAAAGSPVKIIVGVLCILTGFFAFGMLLLKIFRRLRRKGIL